jgi:hypothetical protein
MPGRGLTEENSDNMWRFCDITGRNRPVLSLHHNTTKSNHSCGCVAGSCQSVDVDLLTCGCVAVDLWGPVAVAVWLWLWLWTCVCGPVAVWV